MQPHRTQYWLNAQPEDPKVFEQKVKAVCELYQTAPALEAQGIHLVSSDEMTGIQALERAAPTQPMRPGKLQRQEFEPTFRSSRRLKNNYGSGSRSR